MGEHRYKILIYILLCLFLPNCGTRNSIPRLTSSEFSYINDTGKYVPKTELAECINVNFPNYDRDTNSPLGIELENQRGTMAGVILYAKGVSKPSPLKAAFIILVFDAKDRVERAKGGADFEILESKPGVIYAKYFERAKVRFVILVNNRFLIEFYKVNIPEVELYNIVISFDISRIQGLI